MIWINLEDIFQQFGNEATLHEKQYGWIIFGVKDKTHEVSGTNYCENDDFNKVKSKFLIILQIM